MSITPRELRDLEIKESLRGYNRDEVNDLLERAAAAIEEGEHRIADLAERLAAAESTIGRTRETEDVLNRTLVLAQRAADEAREEATREARRLLDDAEARASRIVADAEDDVRARTEAERMRIDSDISALEARREEVAADLARLEAIAADRRAALVAGLEADLATIRSGAVVPDSGATSPVGEDAVRAPVDRIEPVPAVEPAEALLVDEPSEALLVDDAETAAGADVETAAAADAVIDVGVDAGPATGEVDMQSLFGDVVSPDEDPAEVTIEATATALFGEVGSAEVLDDDAFFATLREAVDDDSPLGPREDEGTSAPLFDQDAKESGFRDVFRRRR